jgi:ketosteroid isomerase-like protein
MLAADFRGVYANGINKADKEVADVRTLDFKSLTLGEMDVVFIDKDAAMVTYPVTIEGTEGGKDISGKANAASIWKKEGTGWRIIFHTDMKAE